MRSPLENQRPFSSFGKPHSNLSANKSRPYQPSINTTMFYISSSKCSWVTDWLQTSYGNLSLETLSLRQTASAMYVTFILWGKLGPGSLWMNALREPVCHNEACSSRFILRAVAAVLESLKWSRRLKSAACWTGGLVRDGRNETAERTSACRFRLHGDGV